MNLLGLFLFLYLGKLALERGLARLNRSYYENPTHQAQACQVLGISSSDFQKTLLYARDKERFAGFMELSQALVFCGLLACGGAGWVETLAKQGATALLNGSELLTGLLFFALLGSASFLLSLPFEYAYTFGVEEKHGFNRQTRRGFFADQLKSLALSAIMGGLCLAGILWLMQRSTDSWWLWAWAFTAAFMLLTTWLYPTLLAPLFNSFTPIQDKSLQEAIFALAEKVGFQASGLFVMDASRRSSHGNAYFTGVFGKKRIVLFDNLLKVMNTEEIVAVLAHELGHFKLQHVRWRLIQSLAFMGLLYYALSLCLPLEAFYQAFSLESSSGYGALFVFSLWLSVLGFFLAPLHSWFSRKHEFAADAFAAQHTQGGLHLSQALLKLRESNHSMPLSHPLYSLMYHSHPPLMARLNALSTPLSERPS